MKKKTLEALKGSIKKWNNDKMVDCGVGNCPLCQEFPDGSCVGCPVELRTKFRECKHTPYMEWVEHHIGKHIGIGPKKVKCKECSRLRKAEKKFLQSLLPKEGNKNDRTTNE